MKFAIGIRKRGLAQFYLPVDVANGVELPVLDFQHQQATARVEDDEVGMHIARAERYVVPEQPVVFELLFEAVGQASLATCHVRHAGADCRYQRSQGRPLCFCIRTIMPFKSCSKFC